VPDEPDDELVPSEEPSEDERDELDEHGDDAVRPRKPEFLMEHAQTLIGGVVTWPDKEWDWVSGIVITFEIVEAGQILLLVVAPDDGGPVRHIPVVYDTPDCDLARAHEEQPGHYLSWAHKPGRRYPEGYCRWRGKAEGSPPPS
jgi:hypothetical protein